MTLSAQPLPRLLLLVPLLVLLFAVLVVRTGQSLLLVDTGGLRAQVAGAARRAFLKSAQLADLFYRLNGHETELSREGTALLVMDIVRRQGELEQIDREIYAMIKELRRVNQRNKEQITTTASTITPSTITGSNRAAVSSSSTATTTVTTTSTTTSRSGPNNPTNYSLVGGTTTDSSGNIRTTTRRSGGGTTTNSSPITGRNSASCSSRTRELLLYLRIESEVLTLFNARLLDERRYLAMNLLDFDPESLELVHGMSLFRRWTALDRRRGALWRELEESLKLPWFKISTGKVREINKRNARALREMRELNGKSDEMLSELRNLRQCH